MGIDAKLLSEHLGTRIELPRRLVVDADIEGRDFDSPSLSIDLLNQLSVLSGGDFFVQFIENEVVR